MNDTPPAVPLPTERECERDFWRRACEARTAALIAAEAEVARLRAGLGLVAQVLSGSARVSSMIAQATLDGANILDEDVAIDVCEGYWRRPPEKD